MGLGKNILNFFYFFIFSVFRKKGKCRRVFDTEGVKKLIYFKNLLRCWSIITRKFFRAFLLIKECESPLHCKFSLIFVPKISENLQCKGSRAKNFSGRKIFAENVRCIVNFCRIFYRKPDKNLLRNGHFRALSLRHDRNYPQSPLHSKFLKNSHREFFKNLLTQRLCGNGFILKMNFLASKRTTATEFFIFRNFFKNCEGSGYVARFFKKFLKFFQNFFDAAA